MRQIGLAVHQYCDVHNGDCPQVMHGDNHNEHDAPGETASWIHTLAPWVESVDAIRLCPEDRQRIEGEAPNVRTSYALNGYLREPEPIPPGLPAPVAAQRMRDNEGLVGRFDQLLEKHATIVLCEGVTEALATHVDHVEAPEWFSEENLQHNGPTERAVWNHARQELAVDRHSGTVANYLYADGHVAALAAEQIAEWCDAGVNFAIPPQ